MAVKLNTKPALMVSYVYLKNFEAHKHEYDIRNWAMDSGAFSAWNSGTEIDLNKYIDDCLRLLDEDKQLIEIFSLDVIPGGRAGVSQSQATDLSFKNLEKMWGAGVSAIPTYHAGEPEEVLLELAANYPKIALGGMVPLRAKAKPFIKECFARIWPKPIHGFGICNQKILMEFPFHSVDITTWETGPCRFGRYQSLGGSNPGIRGGKQNLRSEVEYYLKLERKLQGRWKCEMEILDNLPQKHPELKLVHRGTGREKTAFGKKKVEIKLVYFPLDELMKKSLRNPNKKGAANE